ncbi:hypothetical protein VKS41_007189 [Umbelopsis sp. WA50703]
MQLKLFALAALLSATTWAAPAANSSDGDFAGDVPAVDSVADNNTSAAGIVADSYPRRLQLSVYDDKYFGGAKQEFTNTNGNEFPCWTINLSQVRSYRANSKGVDVRFYEDEGCQNMARAFEDSDWDHIWDDDVKKSKYVKVVKVWGA